MNSSLLLQEMAIVIAVGMLAQVVAERLRQPAIVFLLLFGIGGVGLMPWAWALLALGTAGTWRLVRGGVREPTRRSPSPT